MTRDCPVEYRPPSAYVHGDGAVVVVPQRVAAWLDRHAHLSRLRTEHRGHDSEVDNVLVALRLAAMAWSSATGTDPRNEPEPAPPLGMRMTTTEVAAALSMTDRGVRAAIAAGRLPAEQVGGRWVVARVDVEHYRAARRVA